MIEGDDLMTQTTLNPVFETWRAEREFLKSIMHAEARKSSSPKLHVLEAGCGQRWELEDESLDVHITGVDLDPEALRIRQDHSKDLDAAIVGDLRYCEIPEGQFHVVYCSFVLEHVADARLVLERLVAALAPGGILIIRVPDRETVYGFLVRHSPHRMHVWYKKHIEGHKNAGKPGHAPYPTVYDPVVSYRGLLSFAKQHGLATEMAYANAAYLRVFRQLKPAVRFVIENAGRMSRGRLSGEYSTIGVVLRRPPAPSDDETVSVR